jgi:hypothetical protein
MLLLRPKPKNPPRTSVLVAVLCWFPGFRSDTGTKFSKLPGNEGGKSMLREARRSTRVPLKVFIRVKGAVDPVTCEGETIVVNLNGALLSTTTALGVTCKSQLKSI